MVCVVRRIDAPRDVVWQVLSEHELMPRWTPLRRVTLEPAGTDERNGVGAIRVLHSPGGYTIREEITRFEPPRLLGYTLRKGLPTRDHHGLISLSPDGPEGRSTMIAWTIGFATSVPGLRTAIKLLVAGTISLMARHARRTAR